ncbi:HTH domain-containing protein [Methylopila sp. M107]|uniref:HTH domain-containing protein n=1 Tax=Methylopila sp. M107 TaxID=1101190 RepID=UPI00039BA1FE|nr:HTH domain-containing protein [Methylopila sp. M107]
MPIRIVPPERLAEARRLFETTQLSGERIATETGVSRTSIRRYAEAQGWIRPPAAPDRVTLVASLRGRVEKEIGAAEAAIGGAGEERDARVEKMARSLASLVRTLRELAKYDEEQGRRGRDADPARGPGAGEDRDGQSVADLDAFRAELADRIARLRGG